MAHLAKAAECWLGRRHAVADQVQGLVWRGRLRRLEKHHEQAVADLREALRLDPNHYQARLHLALAVLQQSPEESEEHLRILHRRYGDNVQLQLNLAAVCRMLGRLDEAKRLLTELLGAHPKNVAALVELGNLAMDMNQPAAGLSFLRQALALAPDEPQVHFSMSRCLRLTGDTAEATRHHGVFLQINAERQRRRTDAAKASSAAMK
jgi:tetratricopeptide (TPR) repeat protein